MHYVELFFVSGSDIWMLTTVIGCALFLLDDLFVDFFAFIKNTKAVKLSATDMQNMLSLPEKKIGIMIANWHEAEIIERIVAGNIRGLKYTNYEVILGVYPNDFGTLAAARSVEKKFKNVTVVVNTKDGPTSKGQMLNQMVNYIDSYNSSHIEEAFDVVLIQDSEDVIHPYSLKLMNRHADSYDFIQVPVFSMDISLTKLTAGIYIDEFIESHTKDLLVRDHFDAGLPSAGVGTAVTWRTVKKLLKLQNGEFLDEKTLTEDYHLGLTCHDMGVKEHFACEYYEYKDENTGERKVEYIATREYFPQRIGQSIRQKTRWSLGISLQGFEQRKWKSSSLGETYFLWRDRKGLINAPLFTSALIFTIYYVLAWFMTGAWPSLNYSPLNPVLTTFMWANLIFSVLRIANRISLVTAVYGFKVASLSPVRWLLSNFINTASTYNAVYKWLSSKVRGDLPVWAKTDHIIPVGFGMDNKNMIEPDMTPISISEDRLEANSQM